MAEKYELLEDGEGHQRAKHRRLGREVDVYRFPRKNDPILEDNIRSIASKLSKLDHPRIPHLIDFIERSSEYILIVESHVTKRHNVCDAGDLLDRLVVLEQAVDALAHARRHGLAHGNLSIGSLIIDALGNATLSEIGVLQCAGGKPDNELFARDRANLRGMIRDLLSRMPEDDESSRQQNELMRLVGRQDNDIRDFSGAFREWLDRELSLREAKKLEFESESRHVDTQKLKPALLLATCGTIGTLAIGLLAFAVWPTSDARIANHPNSHAPPVPPGEQQPVTSDTTPPSLALELEKAGPLNNPDAKDHLFIDTEAVDSIPAAPPEIATNNNVGKKLAPTAEPASNSTKSDDPTPPTRSSDPFQGAPHSIELPAIDHRTTTELLSADLTDDEQLHLELLGGAGAFKSGVFRLQPDSQEQAWDILFTDSGEDQKIARLKRDDRHTSFAWSKPAANSKSNTYLRNSILVFRSAEWSHELALRKPSQVPAMEVDLSQNRPFDLDIDHPPDLDTVFIEFVPSTESLAAALPQRIMSATGDKMMIGLDAGANSLVILQMESTSGGKLRTTGWARQTRSAVRQRIHSGFERRFRLDLQRINQQLFAMKAGLKSISGKGATQRRRQVETQLRRLEENKKVADTFWQSYQAALATKLNFRVYRQLGERKLMLAQIGN